jgi:Tfp pilus assembly protein PilO
MKTKKLMLVIFLIVVNLLLIFFLVVPKYTEFMSLRQKLGERQAEFDGKYNYYAEVSQKARELQANKEAIDKIDSALPTNVSFGDLVYFLQKKSAEDGLVIKNFQLVKSTVINPQSNIKEIIISLNLLGSYSAFKNFISSLEKSARLFELPNISFSSISSGSAGALQGQSYPFILTIKTYSY